MNKTPTTAVLVHLEDSILEPIEAWRREQPVIPSRSAAVRYFLKKGAKLVRLKTPLEDRL